MGNRKAIPGYYIEILREVRKSGGNCGGFLLCRSHCHFSCMSSCGWEPEIISTVDAWSGRNTNPHLATPDRCVRMSIRFAFWLAQGSISCQSFGRILATLVFQLRVDKPAGKGVVLRPCAKSSITIPRDAVRKAFEQEARLKSVYKVYHIMGLISTFEALQERSAYVCGHFGAILGLDAPCTEL